MIDPVSVIFTLATLATGWILGRHARLRAHPKPLQPICLCGDHYGAHDPETGECQEQDTEFLNGAQEWVRCSCVRYTGPQPVEQYWVPPSADMSIVTAPRVGDRP